MVFMLSAIAQAGDAPKSDVGNFYPFLQDYSQKLTRPQSYLAMRPTDVEQWRDESRQKFAELLAYHPEPVPLNPVVLSEQKFDGYTQLTVRYSITSDRTTDAFLLIPDGLTAPAPAVMALHDHSGIYYYGKEKLVAPDPANKTLTELIDQSYGGAPLAVELVKRGYVVLAPDAFYFGSQRLDPDTIPKSFTKDLEGLTPGTDEYIRAYNGIAGKHETLVAKTIFSAGATWPGIMLHCDRVCLDYLLTRPEVDPNRVASIGLSIGGYRSALLFAMDSRIKVGVVAGWMTTFESLLFDHLHSHTWMLYVPRQQEYFDLPDLVVMNAPRPLLVLNCKRDNLFTLDGMRAAERRIQEAYTVMGAGEAFKCRYDDVHHSLGREAQGEAFGWIAQGLK